MTEADFWREDGHFRMLVEGHAGFDSQGRDIVCAAASMLAQTMMRWAAEHESCIRRFVAVEFGDGRAELDFWTEGDGIREADVAFGVIEGGFRLLAERYPEHVRMKEG